MLAAYNAACARANREAQSVLRLSGELRTVAAIVEPIMARHRRSAQTIAEGVALALVLITEEERRSEAARPRLACGHSQDNELQAGDCATCVLHENIANLEADLAAMTEARDGLLATVSALGSAEASPVGCKYKVAAIGQAAIDWVKDMGVCHFCDYGADDGDGGDKGHDDVCPIERYLNDGDREPARPCGERAQQSAEGAGNPARNATDSRDRTTASADREPPQSPPSTSADNAGLTPPVDVAKALVLATLGRLEYFQTCDHCDAGQPDDDGGDKEHTDECPLYGYDHTRDCEALRAWAKSADSSSKAAEVPGATGEIFISLAEYRALREVAGEAKNVAYLFSAGPSRHNRASSLAEKAIRSLRDALEKSGQVSGPAKERT